MLSTLESRISQFQAWANAELGTGCSTRMSPRQTSSGKASRMTLNWTVFQEGRNKFIKSQFDEEIQVSS